MKQLILSTVLAGICGVVGFGVGWFLFAGATGPLLPSPFVGQEPVKEYPLSAYTFSSLRERQYQASSLLLEKKLSSEELFSSYIFSYTPVGKRMTGQINIPKIVTRNTPVIIMIRGYVPPEIFSTGTGTRNAAAAYTRAGFITIAPDFFGYGDSDPEPENSWQARFEKPVLIIDLITSIRESGVPLEDGTTQIPTKIGMWGHSNGGQIALSVLEIMREPIPTSLWAPVTAPFPYSILFFSDENEDEGKGMRLWVNQLEKDYELKEFSITNYLDGLTGPIQLHHGTADEAALISWSNEFLDKIEVENEKRDQLKTKYQKNASQSAQALDPLLQPIDITYYQYPGADHNLQPGWDIVVERDIAFYSKYLN